ncbi:Cobalt import ATP-binding protein CbiO [Rhodovastum atsumiense]|uniref:ABC transporter ATP-binding protein n=1 Tax=Rhodovastum atsumiense TaxID=504468 RepID=A0A5M6IZP6_9PROT|nr:ATP-binding cassette domain-containing protein [Rhodovastum atsumiense]KAA5612828.1 ATP-binding cassette domain-containing protein [Rhodovastum atsumiense]CAH2601107.1 Cobalt import ATP-binding protein CbiO [Rhodovastum atsumiense]
MTLQRQQDAGQDGMAMDPPGPTLLEAIGLRYAWPGAPAAAALAPGQRAEALANTSLAVRRGVRLALLGGNGAGKSTLLLHFNGTLRPASGEVRWLGRPVDYSRRGLAALRQQVALVFQDPDDQLFAGTLAQDVSFGPLNLRLDIVETTRRVEAALAAVGLEGRGALPLHMLSHGQRKRAAIAGALALRPAVLVLDEPTAGLDPEGIDTLLDHLDALHARGMTVVFSTHDLTLARHWADEVAVLHEGRVLAHGAAAAVLDDAAVLAAAGLRSRRWRRKAAQGD